MQDGEEKSGSGDKRSCGRNGPEGRTSACEVFDGKTSEGNSIGGGKSTVGREGQALDGGTNQRTGRCIRVLYHLDFCGRYDPGKPILEAGSRCDFGRLGIVLCYPFCALGVGNTRAMGKLKRGEGLR